MKSRVTEVNVIQFHNEVDIHFYRDDKASAKIYMRPLHGASVHRLIDLIIKMEEQDKVRLVPARYLIGWHARRKEVFDGT